MTNNYLFRLLFDYRGIITLREYRAGLVVMVMCALFAMQENLLSAIYPHFISRYWGIDHIAQYAYLQSVFNIAFYIRIPFIFIALYVAVNITIKRWRVFSRSIIIPALFGLFSFFIIPCMTAFTAFGFTILDNNTGYTMRIEESTITLLTLCLITLIILGIISGILLSIRKFENDNDPRLSNYSTINSIISIGKLMLVYIILSVIAVIMFSHNTYYFIENENMIKTVLSIFMLIYAVIYFFILAKRVIDAGKNYLKIIPPLSSICILAILLLYLSIASGNILFMLTANAINGVLISLFHVGVLIILALPTDIEKRKEIQSKNDII